MASEILVLENRHDEAEDVSSTRKDENLIPDDHTPRPSRASTPYVVSLTPGRELTTDDVKTIQQEKKEEPSEPPFVNIQRTASSVLDVYDTHLSSPSRLPPSRSSTPISHPLTPSTSDMPPPSQQPGPSNQSRQTGTRRQQLQQQQHTQSQQSLQHESAQLMSVQGQQMYYPVRPASSESSFRSPASMSSAGNTAYSHAQSQQQRTSSYVRQYTMPTASSSVFSPPVQHQAAYAYPPPLHIAGLHSHGHSAPDFYSHRHSPVYPSPPFGPPNVPTSVQSEHSPIPTLNYDYDGSQARSPTSTTPFTPPQPFQAFSFHPAITTTPQFTHSHSSYPSPYPSQQHQYRQPYTYLTSPSPPEDSVSPQSSVSWWYMTPGASQMYYVDAYGNRPNVGLGLGQGFPATARASPRGPVEGFSFVSQDTVQGSQIPHSVPKIRESATGSESEPVLHSPLGDNTLSVSSREQLSPAAHSQPTSDRFTQPQRTIQSPSVNTEVSQRRPFHRPAHRSEWVMWVGNVPNDATHDELWQFFNRMAATPHQSQSMPPALLPAGLLSPDGSSSASPISPSGTPNETGVTSIFLIARSNCAFVNYTTKEQLQAAVTFFNGLPLRAGDPRCPRLVCRVRGKDEDQRAGVGGQRGVGMHRGWVKEQKERELTQQRERQGKDAEEPPQTPSSVSQAESSFSVADSLESNRSVPRHSSSSSTTSSFFTRYYPKRYFILKSLTQYDLDLSVERGLWATQPHNESVLDKAFRTSSDVFLIFGVNKTGEFYGYARMEGPIGKSEEQVSWASRDSQHSRSPTTSFSSGTGRGAQIDETIPEEENEPPDEKGKAKGKAPLVFSPSEHRLAEDSPKPFTPGEQQQTESGEGKDAGASSSSGIGRGQMRAGDARINSLAQTRPPAGHNISAPPELGRPHRRITDPRTTEPPTSVGIADLKRPQVPPIELDSEAPLRAVREQQRRGPNSDPPIEDEDHVKRRDTLLHKPSSSIHNRMSILPTSVPETEEAHLSRSVPLPDRPIHDGVKPPALESGPPREGDPQWGTAFRVRWLKVAKLPFHRTRHLRNPWNHEREVKVSRDGTELEPSVGQALIDEWDKLDQPPTQPPAQTMSPGSSASQTAGRRGGQLRRTQS